MDNVRVMHNLVPHNVLVIKTLVHNAHQNVRVTLKLVVNVQHNVVVIVQIVVVNVQPSVIVTGRLVVNVLLMVVVPTNVLATAFVVKLIAQAIIVQHTNFAKITVEQKVVITTGQVVCQILVHHNQCSLVKYLIVIV